MSEPVTQATQRIVKVFWGLDASLAHARHFPAINWLNSYSLYSDRLAPWFAEQVDKNFPVNRSRALKLLQEEAELNEIVQLVGVDGLSEPDRMKLETCKMIREDFLHQNAFHEIDTYSSTSKQFMMLDLILRYFDEGLRALEAGVKFNNLATLSVKEDIGRFKYNEEKDVESSYKEVVEKLETAINELIKEAGEADD